MQSKGLSNSNTLQQLLALAFIVSASATICPPLLQAQASATSLEPIPLGSQTQINTYTTGDQSSYFEGADVAMSDQGRFLVAWDSQTSPGDDKGEGRSIQGKVFLTKDLLFDGFESGDSLAWSEVTQ